MPPPTTARPLAARIATFERPGRDEWQKPVEVIEALHLQPGMAIADIGAGSGYFTRRFSKAVGPAGKVYAVDIDAQILGYLKEKAEHEHLTNITTIVSQPEDPLLPAHSVDLAFFCDTTHHIVNRVAIYRKVAKALKPGGRLVVIDDSPLAPGHPHQADQLIPRWEAIQEAAKAGFQQVGEFKFLRRQYFLVFEHP
jgi:predicted methyltransferase